MRVVPAELAGKTKLPSVQATTESARRRADCTEHVGVGAEDDLRAGVERSCRELLLTLRRAGMQLGAPVEPADDDVGLPARGADGRLDRARIGLRRPG